jgi:hypothetical protein
MDHADMLEIVEALRNFAPRANIDKMITDHTPDRSGRCPKCHTLGCTLWSCAINARHAGKPVL